MFAAALAACAATDPPPEGNDGGSDATAVDAPAGPGCGNDIIDPGEACDGAMLGEEDCASRGFEAGALACDSEMCGFDISGCYTCGDGIKGEAEECEDTDLGGQSCQGLGYLGGALACEVSTCRFDITGCDTREVLQNHDGNCVVGFGCGGPSGTNGNPQRLVECFRGAVIPPPFWLSEVNYGISDRAPAPLALDLEVYTWTGAGGPGVLVATIPLMGADLDIGDHALQLAEPVEIDGPDFCIGLSGSAPNDGFKATYSATAVPSGTSFIEAEICGIPLPTDINHVLPGPGTWCMGATIDKLLP